MTTTLESQKLQFAFDTEYTVDNGVTWTALAANTLVTIEPEEMNEERKISVRSSSIDATTLDGMDIGVTDVSFDEINIRNATALTSAVDAFNGLTSKKFVLSNAPELKLTTNMLSRAYIGEVFIDELPKSGSARLMNNGAYGYVSPINMGRLSTDDDKCFGGSMFEGSTVDIFAGLRMQNTNSGPRLMFKNGTFGALGHIHVETAKTTLLYSLGTQMLYGADIEYIPSINILSKGVDTSNGKQFEYMFQSLNAGKTDQYYPSINIDLKKGDYGPSFYNMLYYQPAVKFGGLSITAGAGVDSDILKNTAFYANAKKFISKLNVQVGNTIDSNVKAALGVTSGKRMYYSNPDWFPFVSCLGVYSNSSLTGTVSGGPQNFVHMLAKTSDNGIDIFGSRKYKSAKNSQIDALKTKELIGAESVIFCKNGYTSYTDGTDTIILDVDGEVMTTISGVLIEKGQFSADGLKLYAINGGIIDKSGTNGQQMTYTVDVYNTQDGTKIGNTISVPLGTDEWVAGVYQKDDKYGLKVVVNVWSVEQDEDGNDLPYAFKEVRVDSYEPTGTSELRLSEVSGSGECTYVMQDYFESNEFAIVDAVAGTVQRVVGK